MQNAKCKIQNAKSKIQNPKCKVQNTKFPSARIFSNDPAPKINNQHSFSPIACLEPVCVLSKEISQPLPLQNIMQPTVKIKT